MPFSREAFLDVFAGYNDALWPVALALWVLTAAAGATWMLGAPHGEAWLRRALGMNWLWSAVAFHAMFFTRINPAAWGFAAMFLFQAGLFLTPGRFQRSRAIRTPSRRRQALAFALVTYGLVYPAIVWAEGFVYPWAPTFGVPCPTAILTLGFLLASPARSVSTSLVPIVWSMIGGSAFWFFGVHADVVLPVAGLALAADLLRRPLMHRGVAS